MPIRRRQGTRRGRRPRLRRGEAQRRPSVPLLGPQRERAAGDSLRVHAPTLTLEPEDVLPAALALADAAADEADEGEEDRALLEREVEAADDVARPEMVVGASSAAEDDSVAAAADADDETSSVVEAASDDQAKEEAWAAADDEKSASEDDSATEDVELEARCSFGQRSIAGDE